MGGYCRFNGAALRRARRYSPVPALRRGCLLLQRGRAPESAEIRWVFWPHRDHIPASTGPRSGERGDLVPRLRGKANRGCFNGAALRRARRFATPALDPKSTWTLQRGRAPESAEMASLYGRSTAATQLQRGRAPESAEIWLVLCRKKSQLTASTGPRSGERGDEGMLFIECGSDCRFNGAALRRARRLAG